MEVDWHQEDPFHKIEDRLRHLEEVVLRVRQRHSQLQIHGPIQTTNSAGELVTIANGEGGKVEGEKKAKDLGMKTCSGNFFDCNICFKMATDPVLTCCGHLFCWPCFYKLSYAYYNVKECPVCIGKITEEGIIPIYAAANASSSVGNLELDKSHKTDLEVPPRPSGRRNANASSPLAPTLEGIISQQLENWEASSTIQDMLQFGDFYVGLGERVQLEIPNTDTDTERTNALSAQSQQETENNRHTAALFVEETDSFSSLSAMDFIERLFKDPDHMSP